MVKGVEWAFEIPIRSLAFARFRHRLAPPKVYARRQGASRRMSAIGQPFGRIVQVAYLVDDIEVAMRHWLARLRAHARTCHPSPTRRLRGNPA